ncbi:MerR family transcriptional regulator [Gorillibacterium timonense]|uniref:MerR family transcriptional regulator n=1 Tax=Gorillibacterium timonense TaxID=1689269 RepID=UPI00071E5D0E|nr:MerR family transcriptional regulator [Gorillibacterium timonense]
MKIKEVCARTGLTERTVRFYGEQGLIHPHTTISGGREYRDYSEQDVAELETVAELRKLFFTIEEIRIMRETPDRIEEVIETYRRKLDADVTAKDAILKRLNTVQVDQLTDAAMLAASLRDLSETLALPARDIEPDFGRLDGISKEEREEEYRQYLKRQERQFLRGKVTVIAIAAINVLLALLSSFYHFRLFSLLISIALSLALFAGVVWVRYLFAAGLALNALSGIYVLASSPVPLPGWFIAVMLAEIVYACFACITLLRSQAVSEFLYSQKHG